MVRTLLVVCGMGLMTAGVGTVAGCAAAEPSLGWDIVGSRLCTPGSLIDAGCGTACGLGSCTGDVVLRACDGATTPTACAGGDVLNEDDDSCGNLCPSLTVMCPASGAVFVMARAFNHSSAFMCEVDWRGGTPADGGTDLDAGDDDDAGSDRDAATADDATVDANYMDRPMPCGSIDPSGCGEPGGDEGCCHGYMHCGGDPDIATWCEGPRPARAPCTDGDDCTSSLCVGGACTCSGPGVGPGGFGGFSGFCGSDADCCIPGWRCLPAAGYSGRSVCHPALSNGEPCVLGPQCRSGSCQSGVCAGCSHTFCFDDGDCCPEGGEHGTGPRRPCDPVLHLCAPNDPGAACRADGYDCLRDAECCTGHCDGTQPFIAVGACRRCSNIFGACGSDEECCTGTFCDGAISQCAACWTSLTQPTMPGGMGGPIVVPCTSDRQCCSGDCQADGVCACTPSCSGPPSCRQDGCGGTCGIECVGGQECGTDGVSCVTPCRPSCLGVPCGGGNGCGGTCGCPAPQICNAGTCGACVPHCPRPCGSNGCGGSCGSCPSGLGCGATGCCRAPATGPCSSDLDCCGCAHCNGISCVPASDCGCTPRCSGLVCGDDGCGGFCGSCPGSAICIDGACVAE